MTDLTKTNLTIATICTVLFVISTAIAGDDQTPIVNGDKSDLRLAIPLSTAIVQAGVESTEPIDSDNQDVQSGALDAKANAANQGEADSEPKKFKRPKFQFNRQREDWSALRDVPESQLTDPWDSLKYIPLNDDGSSWMSFGGHMRLRLEDWSDFAFGAPSPDDETFLLWRLLLHTDIHLGENLRIFLEGKSALATERDLPGGRRTLDVDSLDLQQGFVDLRIPFDDGSSLTLRPGRQAFLFGIQRLVSPLPWANSLRSWDGVSAIWSNGDWKVQGFWTQFAPVQKHSFNDPDAGTEFYGVYATGKVPDTDIGLDLYWLALEHDVAAFNGTMGNEDRHTVGGRLSGRFGDSLFDYDFEGAYQFGEVGSGDIDAFMIAAELGYKVGNWWGSPRFKVGFDYASGDDTAGGDVETFNHLFPLGHAYLGYIDIIGRQNIIDISPGVTFSPMDRMTVGLTGHFFWRADNDDALYNAGGGVVRAGGLGGDKEVGTELDLTVKYKFDRHLMGLFGYSRFFAGDFIEESGMSDDIDFFYFQLQYTF